MIGIVCAFFHTEGKGVLQLSLIHILDHSEDGSLAAYHESDTASANPAANSADSQEESQTDVTDDTQGYDDSSLEQ